MIAIHIRGINTRGAHPLIAHIAPGVKTNLANVAGTYAQTAERHGNGRTLATVFLDMPIPCLHRLAAARQAVHATHLPYAMRIHHDNVDRSVLTHGSIQSRRCMRLTRENRL